jgi:hypothetical protein
MNHIDIHNGSDCLLGWIGFDRPDGFTYIKVNGRKQVAGRKFFAPGIYGCEIFGCNIAREPV